MKITPLKLQGAFEIELAPMTDERGYFMRTYDSGVFAEHGLGTCWKQENQSMSIQKHTLRGLHFQKPPHAETKLVRVVQGAILDVLVDLRKDSGTFGQWEAIELSVENQKVVYIPKGFAHGFCSLTENAIVHYKVDSPYAPEVEGGIRWDDPTLGISWPTDTPFLSEKDRALPTLDEVGSPF